MKKQGTGADEAKGMAFEENTLVCIVTQETKKATEIENTLQLIARSLSGEYGFDIPTGPIVLKNLAIRLIINCMTRSGLAMHFLPKLLVLGLIDGKI